MLLHIGGTTPVGVASVIVVIFLLIFAMSFAFGSVPEGERKFTREWVRAWFRASAPRFAIAGAFAVAVLVGALLWGSGNSSSAATCDNPIPPLSGTAITDARIVGGITSMTDLATAANGGETERVRTLFYTTDGHTLTHDIDRPLREQAPDLARKFCAHVIDLENQVAGTLDLPTVAQQARSIAADLVEARGALASTTIATPIAGTIDPCSQPLGAVTSDPLTANRINSAVGQMRQAAQLAANGDQTGAQAAFVGDPHNLSHDIDGPLRGVDESLAKTLCESVVKIELHLGDKWDAQIMQTEATKSADLLEQAGRALGILP